MPSTIQLPVAEEHGLRPRGHFGNAAVCGVFEPDPEDSAATTSHFGLSLYMNTQYATFRDEDGTWYNAQRVVEGELASGMGVYRSGDRGMMQEPTRCHAGMCHWRIEAGAHITENIGAGPLSGHNPERGGWASEPLQIVQRADQASWHEGAVLTVSGPLVAAFQWFVPTPDGGMFFTAHPHRASGTYLGRKVEGFFLNDQIYLPRGVTYATSEFFSSVHVALVTGGTEYDDGTVEAFQIGLGRDRFAFACIADQRGAIHQTTDVTGVMQRDDLGFPTHIGWSIDGEDWEWIPDAAPELFGYSGDVVEHDSGIPAYRASEGRTRRVGDTREPVAWMAYVESFSIRG
jgi:hypothetical protein